MVVTIREIEEGEKLLIDYNKSYHESLKAIKTLGGRSLLQNNRVANSIFGDILAKRRQAPAHAFGQIPSPLSITTHSVLPHTLSDEASAPKLDSPRGQDLSHEV